MEQIILALGDRNWKRVSEGAGVNYQTVWKIARGNAGNVSYETVKRLSDYLEKKPGD
ncbi:MAG: helix-turn-helix transcriptional regulator [Candidatus Cloacimonetes bacterium]|nr:helix-turn-helix transcriptional regulator [Candidatus Cloacimonadota bacterium]